MVTHPARSVLFRAVTPMTNPTRPTASTPRDWWPLGLFVAHLTHNLWFAHQYPDGTYDPDLIAYFVYFKNWLAGSTALHDIAYFTVPKPLLVFGLGPLDDPLPAFWITAILAGGLGALLYLIGRDVFGRLAGVLLSAVTLLDIERATLTLRSSADFYVALFLCLAIYASMQRRFVASGVALALSVLVKPITLPCVLHLLAVEGDDRVRARWAALIPVAAVPLVLFSNFTLMGSIAGPERFFSGFDALSEGTAMPTGELIRFVVWVQLVKTAFVSTAPFGFLGLALWLGRGKTRLTHPFLLVPLLFLGGYVAMSVKEPFVPFFRFFWLLQVWFAGFIVFAMVEVARRFARGQRAWRWGVTCALGFFLVDDHLMRQLHYRHHFAGPFEEAMSFVKLTPPTFTRERSAGETVLTPLAFLPYLLWQLDDARTHPALVITAEQVAADAALPPPDWIVYVPQAFLKQETRDYVQRLLAQGGYEPRLVRGEAALLARTGRRQP